MYTQGFISGFALIAPWALQEYRAYGTHNAPEFWFGCPTDKRIKIRTNSESWESNAVSTKPKVHSGHWNYLINQAKAKTKFPILKTSAKSVQTTAEVCADYTCSLYRLQLKSPESTTYLQI